MRRFFHHLYHHFMTITRHRHLVMKHCNKAGIPLRGLFHDLSKYSFAEFFMGVKYYNDGKKSPNEKERGERGFSSAWMHHKGRNKHHFEYWYDFNAPIKTPIIPYKYTVEMICDTIAASMAYMGKDWNPKSQREYFENRKDLDYINDSIKEILIDVYIQIEKNGINKTINKKNLKKIYYKHVKDQTK